MVKITFVAENLNEISLSWKDVKGCIITNEHISRQKMGDDHFIALRSFQAAEIGVDRHAGVVRDPSHPESSDLPFYEWIRRNEITSVIFEGEDETITYHLEESQRVHVGFNSEFYTISIE